MLGAIILVVVLLIFPVLVLMSGALGAALLGWIVQRDVELSHEGSELLELNR